MTVLAGQGALVTGGSRGIGRAVVEELAAHGAQVVFTYARNEEAAQEVLEHVAKAGGQAWALQADARDREAVDAMVASALERLDGIDILVNNAGITRDGLMLRMKDEQWEEVLATNLTGIFYTTRAVLRPMMRQRSGRIINMSSVAGMMGNPGQVNYSSAKAGILGFTRTLAREVASRGITVNAIAPGFIDTALTQDLREAHREALKEQIPLQRFGRPQDVAGAVLYLASADADYVTGTTLVVDGGITA